MSGFTLEQIHIFNLQIQILREVLTAFYQHSSRKSEGDNA